MLPPLLALICIPLLLLPGLAAYSLLVGRLGRLDSMPLLTSIGLSLALWPTLLLYSTLLGLKAGTWWVAGWLLLSATVVAMRRRRLHFDRPGGTTVLLGFVLLLTLALRLYTIRDLLTPLYGDSVHHTIITQLILDRGGVPADYQPYIPLVSYTYHFGFHTFAAIVAWLTGYSAAQAVLLWGQVVNALTVLGAFYLTAGLLAEARWGKIAGLLAAAGTGLLLGVPAAYVNWGRYTQLEGQAVLPFAMLALAVALRDYRRLRRDWPLVLVNALLVSGVFFSHYRVLIFYVAFAVVFWLVQLAFWRGERRLAEQLPVGVWTPPAAGDPAPPPAAGVLRNSQRAASRPPLQGIGSKISVSLLIGVGSLVLSAPWLLNLVRNYFGGLLNRLGSVSEDYLQSYNAGDFLGPLDWPQRAACLLALLLAATLVGLGRRLPERNLHLTALAAGLWVAALYVVANPRRFGLPGAGAVNNFAVGIMLYIPASLLLGYLGGYLLNVAVQIGERVAGRGSRVVDATRNVQFLTSLLFVFACLGAAWAAPHAPDLSSTYVVQQADLDAIRWLGLHTTAADKVLIAAVPAGEFAGRSVVGVDAGSWIPPLAQRQVSAPTLVAGSERAADPALQAKVMTLTKAAWPLMNKPLTYEKTASNHDPDAATYAALKAGGISHIYAAAGSNFWKLDYFKLHPDHFQKLYDTAGARLYRVLYP